MARGCLSVRLSVTFRCFAQRNEDTVADRTMILVSGELKIIRIFAVVQSSAGVKV